LTGTYELFQITPALTGYYRVQALFYAFLPGIYRQVIKHKKQPSIQKFVSTAVLLVAAE